MALYRRKDRDSKVWHMSYADAFGKIQRESTGTENKQLAQAVLDRKKNEVFEQKKLGVKPRRLFSEAIEKFLAAKEGKRTHGEYEHQLGWWLKKLGDKTYLHEITQDRIVTTIELKATEDGCSKATMNRYLAALRGCLRLVTIKYQWLDRSQLPEFFMEEEPKGRNNWLRPEQITRLMQELPEHWRPIVSFALSTGQRMGNVKGLRWDQIDLARRVVVFSGTVMKNGEEHGIALNDVAVEAIKGQIGRNLEYVFTYKGKRIGKGGQQTWRAACERAGLPAGTRQHDLRHTWASMMAQAGASDGVLMAMGSWKTAKMVRRYAHHQAEALLPYAQLIDGKLAGALGGVTHSLHPDEKTAPSEGLRLVG